MGNFLVGFIILQVVLGAVLADYIFKAGNKDDDFSYVDNREETTNGGKEEVDDRGTKYGNMLSRLRTRIIWQRLTSLTDNESPDVLSDETTSWTQWVSDWEVGSTMGLVMVRDPTTDILRCLFTGYDACFFGCIRFYKDPVEKTKTALITASYKRDKCNGFSSPKEALMGDFDESEDIFYDLECSPTVRSTTVKSPIKLDSALKNEFPDVFAQLMDISWSCHPALNEAEWDEVNARDEEKCRHYCTLHPDCVAYCPNFGMILGVKGLRMFCELFDFA